MDLDRPPDIVVVAGGQPVPDRLVPVLGPSTVVIAADSGFTAARSFGWRVDIAVGDFDSVDEATRSLIDTVVPDVRWHRVDKDETDLQLALDVAAGVAAGVRPASRLLVLGVEGGRPDHALANLLAVTAPAYSELEIEMVLAQGRAWVVRDELVGELEAGQIVSVLPVNGPSTVTLRGVRWTLAHEVLEPGTTRGISNEAAGGPIHLAVHDGTLLCIIPDL